jgi:4-amino-4-deoxy-L-arabinose transferase-like glycosyltransferase
LTLRHARGHAAGLGLVLLIALTVRLVWAAYVHPDPSDGRFDDTVWYRGAAHYLSIGEGYVNPFSGTPTAAWPPGYPAFLAAVFKLFGEGVGQTIGANIAVSLVTIALVYAIALVIADRRVALIAAGATAVWPGQIYFTSLTLSEPLFTMLFCAAVLLMLLASRSATAGGGRPTSRALLVAGFGVAVALAALTRGQAMILLTFAPICFVIAGWRWRVALGWTALAAAVALLALTPWAVRNARTNLWIGHSEAATGRMSIGGEHPPLTERGGRTQGEWEAANDRLALRKGLRWMLTHPLDEISLSGEKIRAMYESDATALDWNSAYARDAYYASPEVEDALRATANGFWFAALALAGVGVIASIVRPARGASVGHGGMFWTLPALVLAWTALHLVFFGDSRFHYPIVFAVAIVAARGLVALYDAAREQAPAMMRRYAAA